MRDAINNNPMVQLAVVAVLVLVAGVMLAPQFLGHKKSDSNTSTSSAQLTTPSGSVDLTVKSTPAAPSTGAAARSTAAPAPQTVSPEALVPGRGLPRPVITAWKRGDTVVLLLVRRGGIDDRLVQSSVRSLSADSRLTVFVAQIGRAHV